MSPKQTGVDKQQNSRSGEMRNTKWALRLWRSIFGLCVASSIVHIAPTLKPRPKCLPCQCQRRAAFGCSSERVTSSV